MSDMSNPILSSYVLPQVEGETILDIGTGAGFYGFLLRYAYHRTKNGKPFDRIDGVDIDESSIVALRNHNIYDNLFRVNACKLPFADNSYDTVLCLEQLEHLYEDEFYLVVQELHRVCRKVLIISTPPPELVANPGHPQRVIQRLQDQDFVSYDEFLKLEASAHKSCVDINSLSSSGFRTYVEDGAAKRIDGETCVYFGYKGEIDMMSVKLMVGAKNLSVHFELGKNYKNEAIQVQMNQLNLQF